MGCGSSIETKPSTDFNQSSRKSKKTNENPNKKSNQLPPISRKHETSIDFDYAKRKENLEPLTLICLDENFDENDKQLRSIIDFLLVFNDVEQCEQYLNDLQQQQARLIFFIVSNKFLNEILSHVHHLSQIHSIYVFQENYQKFSRQQSVDPQWIQRYAKVKGIYKERSELFEQLTKDVEIALNIADLIPLTVYSRVDAVQSNGNSTDHLRFLFYQMFFHQFTSDSSSNFARDDFLQYLRPYYSSNRRVSKALEQLNATYKTSSNAFQWFDHQEFLHKVLTQSLLKLNIPILFSLRFFIRDMLKSMNSQDYPSSSLNGSSKFHYGRSTSNEQTFYRGQALAKETFLKIKSSIGEILSMNHFVLVSRNRHESLKILRDHCPTSDLVYRVLFEIKVPTEFSLQKQRPFIEWHSRKTSNESDQDLYSALFFIGSIFRISTSAFDIANDCWIIQLTLYDEKMNEDFSQIFSFLHNHQRNENENLTVLANLLRQISPQSAEQFYKHLLKENLSQLSKVECYRGLGLCYYSENDFEQALIYFEKALSFKPENKPIKSSLHHNLGLVYAKQNQVDEALGHFRQALVNSSSPLHQACVHHNIALIHSQQGDHQEELQHYEEALQLRARQLPAHHLQIASLHNNIGIAYSEIQQYDQALSNLRTALDIRLKLLSDNHIEVARSYANIGTVYSRTKEFRMALEYFNKSLLLFEKQQPLPEEDIEQLNRNMKIINDKMRRKTY